MALQNPPERILLRRLMKNHWNTAANGPKSNGFMRKESHKSLSVYDASACTPREVLQTALNDALHKCDSEDATERERGINFLARQGDSVEKLIKNGWCVARIAESAFTSRGFQVSIADSAGHCDVTGDIALFETYRDKLAQEASLVLVEEYAETS